MLGEHGLIAHAAPGALVMDMSTVDPASTDRLAATLADANLRFVDAPIGRLASHADRGESLFMVGAEAGDFEHVRPMLEAMGTDIHHCGGPGTGIRTKLVNNFLAITSCQMNAEALALAQRFGLDLNKTLEVIHGTTATNGQLKINYATKVLTGDTEPGFQIDLAHKDLVAGDGGGQCRAGAHGHRRRRPRKSQPSPRTRLGRQGFLRPAGRPVRGRRLGQSALRAADAIVA